MTNKIKNSITYKILLSFILLSVFLTVITTAFSTYTEYRNGIKEIQKELEKIEKSFLPVVKERLWEMDESGIKTSLNGLVLLPNIEYAEVKHKNRIIASAGVHKSKHTINSEFPLYYDFAGKKIHLGAVYISAGMENIYANLYKRALINLISHGLEILSISLCLFLAVNFFVIRRLKTIADYFKQMELGSLSKHLILKGHPVFDENVDEVSQIVNAVNAMNAKIKKFIAELETEIERRKQADIATCESEGKFRKLSQEFNALLNAIPDTLVLLSPDMKVIWANQGAAAGLGKDLSELMGQSCYSLWHQRTTICAGYPSEKSFQSGEIENKTILSPDGRLWDLRAVPIKDAGGKVISVIEVTRDITEHRKLEEQLQQSQKMEAVGTLTGGIAHDFNNILTAIIGYGNILKMKLEQESPLMGYTDQILASAERAANLTQSLLAFSRKQVINPKPVNLNEITASVEKILLRIIGEDIELKTILSGIRDLKVMADAGQIEQVLMNLAANARDAMPEGGTLTIETGTAELDIDFLKIHEYGKPGMYAMITVTDTGHGMDENTRQRIFEPFFTTKEVGKGTGLGLSMVYGIIKQHSGYINCYSEQGKGTTFRIYLPLIKEEAKEAKAAAEGYTALTGGTETILLAEDEEEVRKLMKLVLEEAGYKVIEAVDGKEALEKFRENKDSIDLLLLDVIMPKINGKGVYEEAKKIKPDVKALFSSGYPADFIHKQGILEEGLNFISKPASPHELLKRIREAIDK